MRRGGTLPAHLGSYAPDDVTFLLTDISDRIHEQPIEEREAALRSGARHYSETLAAERPLTPRYRELVDGLLLSGATRVAEMVAVLGERLLAECGPDLVLVSLARAGTPVGVQIRRWLRRRHGIEVPHYGISIIRDRGIDMAAMRWLAAHHDPATLRLVDGWTGKGVICAEVAAAVPGLAAEGITLDPAVAVLADPGRATRLFATREDVLIPSACLNATISGLVSRTVLDKDLIGPDDFHGVKWYRELAAHDRSTDWIEMVEARFDAVGAAVPARLAALDGEAPADGRGMAETRALMAELGIEDVNLLKPGIGEATRVLLRRVPRMVLIDPVRRGDLTHVVELARERGVPVIERPLTSYACWSVIAGSE